MIGGKEGIPEKTEAQVPVGVQYDGRRDKILLAGQLINPLIVSNLKVIF